MRATWNVTYSSRWAYVDSILTVEDGKPATSHYDELRQTNTSWRSNAIYVFIFNGKVVRMRPMGMSVECDTLDEEFIRLAGAVPANAHEIWKGVYDMLIKGESRQEALDYMRTMAIARNLKQ